MFLEVGTTRIVCLWPIAEPGLFDLATPEEVDRVVIFPGPGTAMPLARVKELYGDDIVRSQVMGTQELPGLKLIPDHDRGEVVAAFLRSSILLGSELRFDRVPGFTEIAVGTMRADVVPSQDALLMLKTVILVDGDGRGERQAQFWSAMGVHTLLVGQREPHRGLVDLLEQAGTQASEQALIEHLIRAEDEAFLGMVSDEPWSQFQLGVFHAIHLDYPKALEAFEKAADGGMVEAWASVASMRLATGDRDGALAAGRAAVTAMPGDPISQAVLDHVSSGEDLPAVQRFTAHARRGVEWAAELVDAGDHEQAEVLLRRARELDPRDAGVYAELGALLSKVGRESECEELYRHGVEFADLGEALRFNLGNSLLRQQRWDEAIAQYDRCLEIVPDWEGPRLNREAALRARG